MTARQRRLALSWGALAVVVLVGLAVATFSAAERTPAERARDLSGQFACPQCDGQAVRESDVGASVEIRAEILRRVQAGQSDEEILGALADAYGDHLLLTPSASGTSSLVWALPVALAVVGLAGLAYAFSRWRPRDDVEVDPADRALVEEALRRRQTSADGPR